jgi:hypothetical protein
MEADLIVEASGTLITHHFAEPNDESLCRTTIPLRLSILSLGSNKSWVCRTLFAATQWIEYNIRLKYSSGFGIDVTRPHCAGSIKL